ncbi:MAG: hypothetical protein JKY23_00455 [Nitrospinaceae bacterium]|nr:hypothetical protein [Nitrospinaceae bacterium]
MSEAGGTERAQLLRALRCRHEVRQVGRHTHEHGTRRGPVLTVQGKPKDVRSLLEHFVGGDRGVRGHQGGHVVR